MVALTCQAADPMYNETADAKAEIKQALAQAATTGVPVLVIFGAIRRNTRSRNEQRLRLINAKSVLWRENGFGTEGNEWRFSCLAAKRVRPTRGALG